nr:hypothetical protein [uncultured Tyzzerella sp.]
MLKYLFKNNKSNINIDTSLLEDIKDNNEHSQTEELEEIEESSKYTDMSEMFSDKGSIFLMIGLFLFFIAIIIYISLRRFF